MRSSSASACVLAKTPLSGPSLNRCPWFGQDIFGCKKACSQRKVLLPTGLFVAHYEATSHVLLLQVYSRLGLDDGPPSNCSHGCCHKSFRTPSITSFHNAYYRWHLGTKSSLGSSTSTFGTRQGTRSGEAWLCADAFWCIVIQYDVE